MVGVRGFCLLICCVIDTDVDEAASFNSREVFRFPTVDDPDSDIRLARLEASETWNAERFLASESLMFVGVLRLSAVRHCHLGQHFLPWN